MPYLIPRLAFQDAASCMSVHHVKEAWVEADMYSGNVMVKFNDDKVDCAMQYIVQYNRVDYAIRGI